MQLIHINKRIASLLYVVLLIAQAGFAEEINYLTQNYYGFEDGGTAFWLQHEEWSISSEKAADGSIYAIKFSSDVAVTDTKKAHGGSNGSGISLPVGNYKLKLKVWVAADATYSSFNFTIKEPVWKNVVIDIESVATEQWIEVVRDIVVTEEIVNSGSLLTVSDGQGTFYVDEIQIWGEGVVIQEPELLPFTSSIETIDQGNLNLPKGEYQVSASIYVPDTTTISKFYSQIKEPWTSMEWQIDALDKNQWITVTRELILNEDVENSQFSLFVSNHPEFGGGKGTFLIDDIKFVWQKDVSIKNKQSIKFKVFPNPATDIIYITSEKAGEYKLYNMYGKIVKADSKKQRDFEIFVGDLRPGMYFLNLKGDSGSSTAKVVVK